MTQSVKKPNSLRKNLFVSSRASQCAIAAGMSVALTGAPAIAQDDEEITLDTLEIHDQTLDTNPYAEPGAPYKAKISGDKRRVKPLAETPSTISVLTQSQIKDSGKTDLKDVLAAQPGITLGTGENGNAFGDRYIIRGHEARSDVFVDGLRDPGMTTRESFAVEQIEITKGPSSTFAGRGATGGAVNSITKQANTEYNFNKIEGGVGTDEYRRFTLDSNTKISDSTAFRANFLHAYEEVPDRSPADRERNGAAISLTIDPTEKLSLTGDIYYLDAEDKPDLGVYIEANGDPVDELPTYVQKEDFLESEVTTYTLKVGYAFSDTVEIENKLRSGTVENGYLTTGARGTFRAEESVDGDGNIIAGDQYAPGAATVSLSTHQGWQEVDYFVNQANLYFRPEIGATKHQFIFSVEYSDLSVLNGVYSAQANPANSNCVVTGRRGVSNGYCIVDPGGNYIVDNQDLMGRTVTKGDFDSDYSIKTTSVALMDTIDFGEKWTLHAGIRVDSFDYLNAVVGRGETEAIDYEYSDDLFNGHFGLVHHVNDQGNVYFGYGTSTNINGGESDLGASCGYGGICTDAENIGDPSPETTENLEFGTKWNLNDEKLLLSAAVFHMTKTDVMESLPGGTSYSEAGTINTGENKVKGFELSLSGNLNAKLSTQLGVTLMDSEITKSNDEDNIGEQLSNFASESAFAQLRYRATEKFSAGGTITYSSELYAGQPDSAAGTTFKVPRHHVVDLFASYDFTKNLAVRLNIGNVSDEDYYLASYRSGAFTYKGDALNAQLAVSYEF